jgi:hypothetical protein
MSLLPDGAISSATVSEQLTMSYDRKQIILVPNDVPEHFDLSAPTPRVHSSKAGVECWIGLVGPCGLTPACVRRR